MVLNRLQLEDMYAQGMDFEIPHPTDSESASVTVYIRKMNPNQQQRAVRKANAAQIKMKQLAEGDSDELLIFQNEIDEMGGRDAWIEHLSTIHAAGERAKIEQEVSAEEEWAEEGYLQSMVDLWDDEMQLDYLKGDDASDETKRIWEQMQKFSSSVESKVEVIQKLKAEDYEQQSDDEIRALLLKDTLNRNSGMEWLRVYRDYQILFGVEDPDSHTKLYENINEVENLPLELYKVFVQGIASMSTPVTELK